MIPAKVSEVIKYISACAYKGQKCTDNVCQGYCIGTAKALCGILVFVSITALPGDQRGREVQPMRLHQGLVL